MSDQLFDHAVRDWLDDGSDRTPQAAIDAVLLAVKTTPQERDLRVPRRFTLMPTYMRLAAGIAIVAVASVAILTFLSRGPGFGATPTATPAATSTLPTVPPSMLDTSTWTAFTSTRYGYDIAYPSDWTAKRSDGNWSFPTDQRDVLSHDADVFGGRTGPYLTVFGTAMPYLMTPEDWIALYFGPDSAGHPNPCTHQEVSIAPSVADGHPVRYYTELDGLSCGGSTAFVFIDGHVLVFNATATNLEPLLGAFLSTVQFGEWTLPTFPPAVPSPTRGAFTLD